MSAIFDSISVPNEVKRFVDHSFDIVDQIFDILERQGKTQRDLASMLCKKESEISKWMQGTHNFTIKSIAKIESALGESIMTTPSKAKVTYVNTKMIPVRVSKAIPVEMVRANSIARQAMPANPIYDNGLKVA